jgi:hypothetical protein
MPLFLLAFMGSTGTGVAVDEAVRKFDINSYIGDGRNFYRFSLRSRDYPGDCPLLISLDSYLGRPSSSPEKLEGKILEVSFEKSTEIPADMSQRDFNRVVGCNSYEIFPITHSAIHEINTKSVSPDKGCKTLYIAEAKSDFSDVVPKYIHLLFPVDENEVKRVRRFLEEDYWMTISIDGAAVPI